MLGIFNSAKHASDQMVLATIFLAVDMRNESPVSSGCWPWEDCWFQGRKGVEAAGGPEVEGAQSESGVLTERDRMKAIPRPVTFLERVNTRREKSGSATLNHIQKAV